MTRSSELRQDLKPKPARPYKFLNLLDVNPAGVFEARLTAWGESFVVTSQRDSVWSLRSTLANRRNNWLLARKIWDICLTGRVIIWRVRTCNPSCFQAACNRVVWSLLTLTRNCPSTGSQSISYNKNNKYRLTWALTNIPFISRPSMARWK